MTVHTAITDYYAGATLDAGSELCHRTTDATVYTASATPELTPGGGVYAPVFTGVAAGSYRLKLKSSGEVVATRDVTFAGTDGETVQTGVRAVLDPASVTAIRDGIPKVGETHRYTQVDSGATTTDVSIGAAT